MKELLSLVRSFPDHFDESSMFNGGGEDNRKLKAEFRDHFRNVSRIMDCVGCDKCKLWGKLQVRRRRLLLLLLLHTAASIAKIRPDGFIYMFVDLVL